MNRCANIRPNITTNNMFSNYKYLITKSSYYRCSPPNVEPTLSSAILDSGVSHTFLQITIHYVNMQRYTTKGEVD